MSALHPEFSRRAALKGGALVIGFSMLGAGPSSAARGDVAGPPNPDTIDTWIAIHSDNTATINFGKVDLGQGSPTGLLQVAAEELDLGMDQVRSVRHDTNVTPNQGPTSSSSSIHRDAPKLRAAAAEARQALLARAARRLGVQTGSLTVSRGVVSVRGENGFRSVTYAQLLGDRPFDVKFTGTAPLKPAGRYTLVGASPARIDIPAKRRPMSEERAIVVKGARANNLKGIDVAFPMGGIVCVTGVSGSGKSTLVNEILLKAAQRAVSGAKALPAPHDRVNGLKGIDRVVEVDQSPIGRTPRSNPATYTGVFDDIRKLYAAVPESKARGYEPGRFSFNVKGGRCEACQGQGVKKIEMHFLPDVFVACEACKGTRYAKETLDVRFKGKNIAECLDMTVEDGVAFFDAHPRIRDMLACVRDVGLGYMQLGQASTTLSGGEAQRVKLATELGSRSSGTALYVLDEPTTGLHFDDVRKLLEVLQRLAEAGHTLIVIEHNLDVVKCADWLVDLGPEGGDRGGTLVASGTPEQLAKHATSHTGAYLKRMLVPTSAPTPRRKRAAAKP